MVLNSSVCCGGVTCEQLLKGLILTCRQFMAIGYKENDRSHVFDADGSQATIWFLVLGSFAFNSTTFE